MKLFVIFFYLYILSNLNGEEPISICSRDRPFRISESKCANFSAICVKQGNDHCNQWQKSCKQCPPREVTVIMLQEILKIVKYQFVDFFIAILIVNFAIIFLLVFENRFKLISKFLFSFKAKGKVNKYQLLHSRRGIIEFSNFTRDFGTKLKFQIPGQDKVIELHVYGNENVVKIKKRICKKWPKAQSDSYKIMKLIYKGSCLDDNQNIMSHIRSYKGVIICQMDYSVNSSDILVLRVNGIKRDTELVQINKNKKISDLNQILCKLFDQSNLITLVKHTAYYSELNNHDLTLAMADIKDNDRIAAIVKKAVKVKFSSLIDSNEDFVMELSSGESFSSIINTVKQKFKSEDFVLVVGKGDSISKQFLFQYNIEDDHQIPFCRFYALDALSNEKKLEPQRMDSQNQEVKPTRVAKERMDSQNQEVKPTRVAKERFRLGNQDSSRICKATDNISNKEVALMKYKLPDWKSFISSSNLIKELRKLEVLNANERFVQIFGIYKSVDSVSVSMELMDISLNDFLCVGSAKTGKASNEQVIKWSRQILEGLACLHDHGILYDNLTMSHILLDSKENIKLSSINIGKIIGGHKNKETNESYFAPEKLKNEPLKIKADVWSFGIVLLEIITGKYFNFKAKIETKNDAEFFKIDYSRYKFPEGIDKRFQGIIDNCLVVDPNCRISVKELLQSDLLTAL